MSNSSVTNATANRDAQKKYNFCTSQLKSSTEKFVWTIDNFSKRQQKTGEYLESSTFISTAPSGNQLKWRLKIYPNGEEEEYKEYVSMYLTLIASTKPDVLAKFRFFIRDGEEAEIEIEQEDGYSEFNLSETATWGYNELIKRDVLFDKEKGLMPGDQLTIVCELTVQEEMMKKAPLPCVEVPECRVVSDMGQLFEKSLFTDFVFIASDGKEFKVHKCILAGRSTVFAAMFEHGMTEAQNGTVKIKDIRSDVLEQMLRFIYGGTAPELKKMPDELLIAANKYGLDRLKIQCEKKLVHSMSIGNVCLLLLLANMHSAEHLKTEAITFIQNHADEVLASEGWNFMVKDCTNVELVNEVVKAIANRK